MSKRAWILLTLGVIAIVVAMLYLLDITRYKPENEHKSIINFSAIFFSEYKVEATGYGDERITEMLNDTTQNIAIEANLSHINNLPIINIIVDEKVEEIEPDEPKHGLPCEKTYEVINHNTGEKELLLQDDNNRLMLKDIDGKVLWERQLDEEIISDVKQIDYYKNNKLQYLFRTKSYIHLIDRNGNNTANFPVPYLNDDAH